MKSHDKFKSLMEVTQQQMDEASKNESPFSLKEVKCLCEELSSTASMLKGSLAECRKKK